MEEIRRRIMDAVKKAAEEESETVQIPVMDALKLVFVLEKVDELDKEINRRKE